MPSSRGRLERPRASVNIHCHGEVERMSVLEVGVAMPRGLKRLSSEFICFTRTEAADCMSFDHSVPSSQSIRFARYKVLVTSEDSLKHWNLGFHAMYMMLIVVLLQRDFTHSPRGHRQTSRVPKLIASFPRSARFSSTASLSSYFKLRVRLMVTSKSTVALNLFITSADSIYPRIVSHQNDV